MKIHRYVFVSIASLGFALATTACKPKEEKKPKPTDDVKPVALVGIDPKSFQCDSLIKESELQAMVGGSKIRRIDSAYTPPKGVPLPCNYVVEMPAPPPTEAAGSAGSAAPPQPVQAAWTFDLDCRDGAKVTFDRLVAQYEKTSQGVVNAYNEALDAGEIKADDAGVTPRAPGSSNEVPVGARALDHHGQGLVFYDDDAPCYVRIVGGDAKARFAVGKHLANSLTPKTAPMTSRRAQ